MKGSGLARFLTAAVVGLAGCAGSPADAPLPGPAAAPGSPESDAAATGCPSFRDGETVGTIGGGLTELSGMVAGRRNPDVLWVHEDSDGAAEVAAVGLDGKLLGRYRLAGVSARDWEDVTIGPGPTAGVPYLYVGDVGDNLLDQERFRIVRFPEPEVTGRSSVTVDGAETLTGRYPDGPHNAEALASDPRTGDLYVWTKDEDGPSALYRWPAPQTAGTAETLERVGEVDPAAGLIAGDSRVTAADISPGGGEILLRTYTSAWWWERTESATVAGALAATPCQVPLRLERQGEAIAWAADAAAYFSTSEGRAPPLSRYRRDGQVSTR